MDIPESEQPKFKRRAMFASVLLIVWIGATITAAVLRLAKLEFVMIPGVFGSMALFITIFVYLAKLSNAKIQDKLAELGFEKVPTVVKFWRGATTELPPEIESFVRALAGIGAQGQVFFAAYRKSESGDCWIIRHLIQHGKSSTIRNIFLLPHSTQWPVVQIHRRGITDVLRKVFGGKAVVLAEQALNEQITVMCSDEEFANLMMGPELAQIAVALKAWDQLVINGEGVCLISMSMLSGEKLPQLVELVERVRAAIPPELAEWEPPRKRMS